jgi:hypothetical protein
MRNYGHTQYLLSALEKFVNMHDNTSSMGFTFAAKIETYTVRNSAVYSCHLSIVS